MQTRPTSTRSPADAAAQTSTSASNYTPPPGRIPGNLRPNVERALPRGRYRRDLSPQDRSERQRLQLLTAAAQVFAAKGFADTAVEDVVKAAGMSRATFYIHFQDKDELLGELYDTGASATIRSIRQAAAAVPKNEPLKRLEKAFDTYLFMLTNGGDVARVIVNEVAAGGPKMLERRDRVHQEFIKMFRELAAKVYPGHTPSDMTLLAVVSGVEGLVFNYLWRGEARRLDSEGRAVIFRFMLNALRP